ncbi:ABC transporter substrate-binding protein [Devosia sp.]|uniref:ABC transporter substrate-binding protein n=1 Tax=Devosia sp. TaxID=1871048 RepID=UPI003BA97A4B
MERKAHGRAARAAMATAFGAVMMFSGVLGAYAQDKTEITFSYLWGGAEGQALEQIVADFNASQDKIVVKGVSSPDMTKQLASMSSSKGAFDISDNFASNIASWANQGILQPLNDFNIDTADFPESVMQQLVVDGQLYSVPIATHNFQLIYNKKLLDEAGVTPPTTMAELADAIKKLTKVDASGNVTQLGLGLTDVSAGLKTLGYAFGGDWNRDGKPTPTDENFIKGVQFYYDNVVAPVTPAAYNKFVAGFGPYMSDQDSFKMGKIAMVFDGEWRSKFNTEAGMDWGVVPVPGETPELLGSTWVDVSTIFIPTNSPNKEAAAEFLKYLISPPAMEKFSHVLANLPGRLSLTESATYDDLPNFKVWLDALKSPNTHGLPPALYMAEYNADLASAFDAVLQGSQTPADALKAVADRTSSYTQ